MARPKQKAARPVRRVRVRSRPLAEVDDAKLATALVLMGRRLVEQLAAETDASTGSTASPEEAA